MIFLFLLGRLRFVFINRLVERLTGRPQDEGGGGRGGVT